MDDVLLHRAAIRHSGGRAEASEVVVLLEAQLTIVLDGRRLVSLMCLPRDLDQLAVGFLQAEGLLATGSDLVSISGGPTESGHQRKVELRPELARRTGGVDWVVGTGCGGSLSVASGDRAPARVESDMRVGAPVLVAAMVELSSQAHLYQKSRGCHSAGLFAESGRLVYFAEDIGRHNAIDKVNGARLLADDGQSLFMVTTGRMTTEICWKAIRMGCPVVASPSVASSQAVEMAGEAGIALVGRLRGQSMYVYSHPWRVLSTTGRVDSG